MAQLRIDFQGRGKVETFSRARVQPMGDGVQLALRVARQVRALGQVLAQQPVRVFVGAALPRAVRIGKEDLDRKPLAKRSCSAISFPRSYVRVFRSSAGTCRSFFVKPSRALRASVPSIRARMTRRVVRSTRVPTADPLRAPLMRSPSQWPGTVPGGHLGGSLSNRRHIGDLAASIRPSRPRPARFARLTQRGQPCAAQGSAGNTYSPA